MKLLLWAKKWMSQSMFWLTFYLMLLGGATTYGFWVDHQQDIVQCEDNNKTIIRATRVTGKSILEAAAKISDQPPSQEAIDIYLEIQEKNIQSALEDC